MAQFSYRGPGNVIKRAALIVALLYVGALLVPGFFLHHAADTDGFVVSADYHYGLVFGSALRAAEADAPSALRVNFGLLSTATAGWLARLFGIETFAGWIRFTQSFQVLFLLCAVAGAWALRRDSRIVLVVLFAIAPFASTVNPFVLNPNISGFRFLCFALLPIVLAVLKQREGFPEHSSEEERQLCLPSGIAKRGSPAAPPFSSICSRAKSRPGKRRSPPYRLSLRLV